MNAVDPDALRDDQWERIKDLIPGGRRGQRGPRCDNRRSWTPFSGWPARARAGATCPSAWATTGP